MTPSRTRAAWRALGLALALVPLAAFGARSQPGAPSPAAPPRGASSAAGKCGVCHPSERVQFETSQHASEQVRCVACHGGNDASLEMPVAHSRDFRGRPARKDVPALCASCHANETRMRAYNLPVDQYALYQTSGHGRRLAAGDTRVAVCTDCHGAHAILAPSDPGSSVFPTNIPKTCGRCHGDAKLMPAAKAVYADYAKSVHASALLDRGNLKAPTCVSCHGVHGAAPPAVGDIDKVCGQCHTAERRYFTAGPHRHADSDSGPECSSCHGAHDIEAAQPERIASSCERCHGKGSPQVALGARMWTEYKSAFDELERASANATRAEAIPINTDDYRARLEEARTYLSEAMPAAHAVQEEVVAGFTTRARSVAQEVESDIRGKLANLRVRRYVLILFWFYLLLTIVALRRFQKRTPRT